MPKPSRRTWLFDQLASGPRTRYELKRAAVEAGVSGSLGDTFARERAELGVTSSVETLGPWRAVVWRLPTPAALSHNSQEDTNA